MKSQAFFGVVFVLVLLGAALPAMADMFVTFSAGATLADFGFAEYANGPLPSSQTDTVAGVWNHNIPAGKYSEADLEGAANVDNGAAGDVIHGYADILVNTFSTNVDDQTLLRMADYNDVDANFFLYYTAGNIRGSNNAGLVVDYNVANGDGLEHRYGWQLDRTTGAVSVYFDGVMQGASFTPGGGGPGTNKIYIGDGTAGNAHSSVWNNFVVASGTYIPVPEPSTLALLATGLAGLLCYAWRKRK